MSYFASSVMFEDINAFIFSNYGDHVTSIIGGLENRETGSLRGIGGVLRVHFFLHISIFLDSLSIIRAV